MTIKSSGLILVHHAAEILICTPRTIINKIKNGDLEGYKSGHKYLVKKESVLKYLEKNKVKPENYF